MSGPAQALEAAWKARWPEALALWSKFTQLSEPRWCATPQAERAEHLTSSFAMIRLDDKAVVISLRQVAELKLEGFPLEVMGHEIGHHVLCPADLSDQGRLIARLRRGLPSKESLAPFVANVYADLLINDRLQRQAGVDMAGVYRALAAAGGGDDAFWTFYMRMCEILWSLPRGSLATGLKAHGGEGELEGDARLGARLIRVYGRDWLRGAGRFGMLCLPYLKNDAKQARLRLKGCLCDEAAPDAFPDGLAELGDDEEEGAIHPSEDPELSGEADGSADGDEAGAGIGGADESGRKKPTRKYREPFEFGEILKGLGFKLDANETAIRYYRERAIPHLVPFPVRVLPESTEPLPEGLETWDIGSPLEEVDWFESVVRSPAVVPGLTTVRRNYGTSPGNLPEKRPVDLYIGVDCSGSMTNPQVGVSFPVLAGTIMALSALRAGAKVMVCLSGEPGRAIATDGFLRDEHEILKVLTGYLGTGYTFGIQRLSGAFPDARAKDRPAHILIVTDHDIFAMLDGTMAVMTPGGKPGAKDEGWGIAKRALERARGGGTYVLHMPLSYNKRGTDRMLDDGWKVHPVVEWEDIVAFARAFSREKYGLEGLTGAPGRAA